METVSRSGAALLKGTLPGIGQDRALREARNAPWPPPPGDPALAGGGLHVWRASLDVGSVHLETLARTLSRDELERARRFRFRPDAERFIAARGLLRTILGAYIGIQPGNVRLSYGAYGKPALLPGFSGGELQFNLAHSGGLALFAVARGRRLGVDLERVRPDVEYIPIAERFFAPGEVAALRAADASQRADLFFTFWVRKEAYLKALGQGLSSALERFLVSCVPRGSCTVFRTDIEEGRSCQWTLYDLAPGPGYVGSLVVEGRAGDLHCWGWSDPVPPLGSMPYQ